jgi:MFS-type transporter involved in bile tolerance (Atg22 family)
MRYPRKGTSWLGNLVFAVVVGMTGSYRQAILALIFFFVTGFVILLFHEHHPCDTRSRESNARRGERKIGNLFLAYSPI